MESELVCNCKYCGKEFISEKRCVIHEERECPLNPNLMGEDEKPLSFLRFVTVATMTVVGIALVVISPMILYPFLLGLQEPYNYLALIAFWAIILGSAGGAALVDYLRKRRTR